MIPKGETEFTKMTGKLRNVPPFYEYNIDSIKSSCSYISNVCL